VAERPVSGLCEGILPIDALRDFKLNIETLEFRNGLRKGLLVGFDLAGHL
jgi:hypothetical protein